MSRRGLSNALALLFLSVAGWSQHPTNPPAGTEISSLQEAIYSASPGAVLEADLFGPRGLKGHIIVDRPITLIGGSYLSISIRGSGPVFLRDAFVQSGMELGGPYPAIEIEGHDLLVGIINSQVLATGQATYSNCSGAPAVIARDPRVRLLLVESTFSATIGGGPGEFTCSATCGGSPAISAYGAVVLAWNSAFYGGGGIVHRWDDSDPGPCPNGPLNDPPVAGGPGLVAGRLWHQGSSFVGGPGSYWDSWPSVGADGPPFVADWHKELPLFSFKAKPR